MDSKRMPSSFELNRAIGCFLQEDTRMALGLLVGLYEDLTVGELCALRWRDIDLDHGLLYVGKSFVRVKALQEDGAKSAAIFLDQPGRERWISLHADTMGVLERWRGRIPEEAYLLRDERPHEPRTVTARYAKLARKAGIPDVTYRELRQAYKQMREASWSEQMAAHPGMDAWVQGPEREAFMESFRRLERTGFTKEEVIEVLEHLLKKRLEGAEPLPEGEAAFEDVADRWLMSVKATLRKFTVEKYRDVIDQHLLPRWKGVPLSSIDQFDYSFYMAELSREYGSSLLNQVNTVLKNMIQYALRQGYLARWPFYIMEPEDIRRRAPVRALDKMERKKVVAYCSICREKTCLGILLMVYEGIRLSELCALQWRDVDLEEGVIHVQNFVQREKAEEEGTRRTDLFVRPSRRARDLPIHPDIKGLLSSWKENELSYHYLMWDAMPCDPRSEANRIERVLEKIGLPDVTCAMLSKSAGTRR